MAVPFVLAGLDLFQSLHRGKALFLHALNPTGQQHLVQRDRVNPLQVYVQWRNIPTKASTKGIPMDRVKFTAMKDGDKEDY